MNNLVFFIIWCCSVFGAANGISNSALLERVRLFFTHSKVNRDHLGRVFYDNNGLISGTPRTFFLFKFIGKLIHCVMCMGFWIGMIWSLAFWSPGTTMGCSYCPWIFDAFLGSAVAWIIYLKIAVAQSQK